MFVKSRIPADNKGEKSSLCERKSVLIFASCVTRDSCSPRVVEKECFFKKKKKNAKPRVLHAEKNQFIMASFCAV